MTDRSVPLPDWHDLPDPVYQAHIRIYYEDTDAGGIVYHANYLRYFERARTDWLRGLGAVHREMDAAHGLLFVVREMALDYIAPARLDDEIIADVRVLESRRATMRLAQCARKVDSDSPLVLSSLRVAAIERSSGRPTGFPIWLRDRLSRKSLA
ncbi:MAG: YbgC/FadM family acyl-CoA thioesterase [Quisquiliibacterium sp.]